MIVCPEQDLLEAYRLGTCSGAEGTDVRLHLDTCSHCRSRMQVIDDDDEAIVVAVRRVIQHERTTPPLQSTLGHYRILRRLGAGGMGVVYEAEQERPRRRVAIKVLRAGAQTDRALRRFEDEAQILGRLQHPGIAQIFEAGAVETELGVQPFLAMELVEGCTLLDHATAESFDVRERLELFADVCAAVEHAHQKGVIHRDLKPANILVVPGGGGSGARPKILDFGVAKLADADRARSSLDTRVGQLVGTIPYMSPEQVGGRPGDLDTRSDVYALGVLLYELLSGRLPHDLADCTVAEAARRITERDPTPLGAVDRVFRGDVASIVMKALEREPSRRYQSAAELAADVRRHLRDEPVAARPVTALYQLQKFARRNTWLFIGVAVVAAALMTATAVSVAFGVRATRAAAEANAQRERSEQVVMFLQRTLAATSPHASEDGGNVMLLDLLVPVVTTIEADFADQPDVVAVVRSTIGAAYLANMRYEDAATHFEAAIDIRERAVPDDLAELAYCVNGLAIARRLHGQADEAERLYREAVALYREAGDVVSAVMAQANLVTSVLNRGDLEEAEQLQREVLSVLRSLDGEDDRIPGQVHQLGRILFRAGRPDEAKVTLMEALKLGERVLPAEHPFFPSTQRRISNVHRAQGELVEAERWERKAIELLAHRRVDSPDRLGAERDLIEILIERGRTRDARTALEARLSRLTEALGANDARTIATQAWLDEVNGEPEAGR